MENRLGAKIADKSFYWIFVTSGVELPAPALLPSRLRDIPVLSQDFLQHCQLVVEICIGARHLLGRLLHLRDMHVLVDLCGV